ncbi:MAG: sulfite exporter TauE/SafE family protein [Betaproteobacteria bacterium]|nr:sulfite exporter TauE/SafE family protein [Betaproteobacteria bacterium]
MDAIAMLVGIGTGILLGLLGSGGSIITIPTLIYLLGVPPKQAIAMSLGIVAISAAISALNHWHRGNVDLKLAAIFGIFGAGGAYLGTRLGIALPAPVQLTLFAIVMYAAAYRMLKVQRSVFKPVGADVVRPEAAVDALGSGLAGRLWPIALLGLAVGGLAGFVGTGGGFLIIPALVLLAGTPMKTAVGTSLVIVTFNCISGFLGYLHSVPIDYRLLAMFTIVMIAGSFAGTMLSHRLSQDTVKRSFGIFLILVASYIVLQSSL